MPVQMDCTFERTNSRSKIDSLQCGKSTLLAWWYCGIRKNTRDKTQPLVVVAFRKQLTKNTFSEDIIYRSVPISLLGQVRIGSLWKNDQIFSSGIFESRDVDIQCSKGGWWFTSFYDAVDKNRAPPFPQHIHPLAYERDRNWLIQFKLSTGGTLIVPCLEYFTRCYGQSGELRRILATYRWEGRDGCLDRLLGTLNEPESPNKWKIMPRKGLVKRDSIFLAHVKYESYTKFCAKRIHSDIDNLYSDRDSRPAFTKIGPWFQGPASLRVSGIPFNNGKSFLALQINGSTDPVGKEIDILKENRNNASNPADPDAPGNAWAGAAVNLRNQQNETLNLTAWEEPDGGQSGVKLDDDEFVILGTPRIIRTLKDDQAKDRAGTKISADTETFSTGEAHGSGKEIGHASVEPEVILESEGALRDMWNAMLHLKKMYPDSVHSIEWFTPTLGFSSNIEPDLIALEPFKKNEKLQGKEISKTTRKWPFMDPKTCLHIRGLLATRLRIEGKHVYIIEIQRRTCKKKTNQGGSSDSEEPYKGLVFTLANDDDLIEWLSFIRSNVRHVRGIVSKLVKHCPGKADSFKHTASSTDMVACWSALKNALDKVDIQLK